MIEQRFPPPAPEVVASESEIAVLDGDGLIVAVNPAWLRFSRQNGGHPATTGVGTSYLAACDRAGDDAHAAAVGSAIREVLAGAEPATRSFVVPCHSPDVQRWFQLFVSPRRDDGGHPTGATIMVVPVTRPVERAAGPSTAGRSLADVLDAVIRQLFAAGLRLEGIQRAGSADTGELLDRVAHDIVDAISHLQAASLGVDPAPGG